MLTKEQNDYLVEVGPGTPVGTLLRRYWHPFGVTEDVSADSRTHAVRLLGEDLVLYLTDDGGYRLVAESCAHRRVSLCYGFVEGNDIRCPYHGWKYDGTGQCIEQPFEQDNRRARERAKIAGYPVQEYRGLLFAYLGGDEPPVLPRWDVMERRDGHLTRYIDEPLQCNWMQPMENAVDTVHTFWLHGHTMHLKGINMGSYYYRTIEKYSFEEFDLGIIKRRVYRSDDGELEEESGHPLVFPNILRLPEGRAQAVHWRVPVDDTRTMIIRVGLVPDPDGVEHPDDEPSLVRVAREVDENGIYTMDTFSGQDRMAWETQGEVYDRTKEILGAEDKGIAMYRRMVREQAERVLAGEEPIGRDTDPAKAYRGFNVSAGQARVAAGEDR
jgi:5,5'-dehydrodivanillate O-demethylase